MIKLYNFDELKPEEILNRDIRAEKNVEDVVDGILADVRARGDGELSKVAQGAAQNGDGAARAIGFAPHTRVAAKCRCGTGGEVTQAAGVVEGRECTQAGEFRLVHMFQRAHGLSVQQLAQAGARLV